MVITRRDGGELFNWSNLKTIEAPRLPGTRFGTLLCRAERKVDGWRHLRHRAYADRVIRAVIQSGAQAKTLVVFNEPETATLLRQKFPLARIVHWFQNQLECKPRQRRLFGQAADIVIGVSDFTSRWVRQYYGLPNVITIFNGVDPIQFYPTPSPPNGIPVIEFVGRTGIEKGPDILLQAAIRLRQKGRQFHLRLIGSNHWDRFELDDYQRKLASLVEELEKAGVRVDRPGHIGRAELPAEMRKAHIHVVPARWDEPFGMTTLEGMACGLAVIASRTGGTPEVLGDAGLYFERESVDGLVEQLDSLLQDPEQRASLAAAGLVRSKKFTWENTFASLQSAVNGG